MRTHFTQRILNLVFFFISPTLGWYFGEADSSELWGGAAVNGLSEFNINKVGWYKYMR